MIPNWMLNALAGAVCGVLVVTIAAWLFTKRGE